MNPTATSNRRRRCVGFAACAALVAWGERANAGPDVNEPATPSSDSRDRDAPALLVPEFARSNTTAGEVRAAPPSQQQDAPDAQLPRAASAPDAEALSYWNTERVVGWSLLGAAAAATGFALYFGSQRQEARGQWQRLDGDSPLTGDELVELEKDYDRATAGMFAATAAAVGFAGFGAVCLVLAGRSQHQPFAAQPGLVVEATGARVGLVGRF